MAKFNSILIGSGSGSVGNVTMNKLRGQNIAKAKITTTTNVKSEGQVSSRDKMTNIVLAYQFLSVFLTMASALRKPTESIYNAFVRLFKTAISDVLANSPISAAALLTDKISTARNYATVTSIVYASGAYTCEFDSKLLPYDSHATFRLIAWSPITKVFVVLSGAITEENWTDGTIDLPSAVVDMTICGCYIYNTMEKKCSEIRFQTL